MSVDFSDIIDNFLTAELGEEVRGSLVEIAEALEAAINSQLNTVTSDLNDPDANTAAQAKAAGDAIALLNAKAITVISGTVDYRTETEYGTIAGLPDNTIARTVAASDRPDGVGETDGLYVETVRISSARRLQTARMASNGLTWTRYYDDGAYTVWRSYEKLTRTTLTQVEETVDALDASAVKVITGTIDYRSSVDYADLSELPANTIARTIGASDRPDGVVLADVLYVETLQFTSAAKIQLALRTPTGTIWTRYLSGGTYTPWATSDKSEVNILCIGNSLTQDAVAYAPYLLKSMIPSTVFNVTICYKASSTVEDYIGYYNNNTVIGGDQYSGIYHCLNGEPWVEGEPSTIKALMASKKWDLVTIQQKGSISADPTKFVNIGEWIDCIISSASGLSNGVKICYLMPHFPPMNEQADSYENMCTNIENAYAANPIEAVIPCGTAVQNARGTSLDEYGDYSEHHMSADGTHLQEGIGCLVAAYTLALSLLGLTGYGYKSILGMRNVYPSQDWVIAKNIPGRNHDSTGVTYDNMRIAQKCAIAAIKKPFEVTEIGG